MGMAFGVGGIPDVIEHGRNGLLASPLAVQALARAAQYIDQVAARTGRSTPLPLHTLIESPLAVHRALEARVRRSGIPPRRRPTGSDTPPALAA